MEHRIDGQGSGFLWPTPRANKVTDEKEESFMKRKNRGDVSTPPLTLAVKMWSTPSCRDYKDSPGMSKTGTNPDGTKRDRTDQLARQVYSYPTPTKFDASCGDIKGKEYDGESRHAILIQAVRRIYSTPTASNTVRSEKFRKGKNPQPAEVAKDEGGSLNPDWVEFLMGWPIGWSRTEPIKMDWRDWSYDPADTGEIPRVATGVKNRVGRLKAIGNGQVPICTATAWRILNNEKH